MSANNKPPFAGEGVRRVRLGDVCEVERAVGSSNERAWLLNLDAVEKNTGRVTRRETISSSSLGSSTVPFTAESVLYSKLRPNLNKVVLPDSNGYATSEMIPLKPDASVLTREYLAAYLRSDSFVRYAVESTAGAKMPRVGRRVVLDAEIPLPPIGEQIAANRRFAAISSFAMGCRRQLSLLDDLVKSRFVETFGDGEAFHRVFLSDCVESIDSGKSPKCESRPREGLEPGVLKLSAISSGTYLENENKSLPSDAAFASDREVVAGDILMARKNTPELVGKCVLVHETSGHIMFPDIIFRMHPTCDVEGTYLSHLLSGPLLHDVRCLAHGSARSMSNIPKSELARLSIPIPPLALQREFAAFAERAAKSQVAVKQEIEKLQTLYDSLSQEYFG